MAGFLKNRPKVEPYNKIKQYMIRTYGKTQLQKDNTLLAMTGLGDRTPTEALTYVRSLNSDPETFFRAWFLSLIPANVRALLGKAATTASLEDMCDEADLIMEQAKQSGAGVASVVAQANHEEPKVQDLEVEAVGRGPGTSRQNRGNPKGQGQGRSASSTFVCHYHAKFGVKAFSCREGCSFAQIPLCLLYTSPSPRDKRQSRMPSSA